MKKVALALGVTGALLIAADLGLNLIAFVLMLAQSLFWVRVMWSREREAAILNGVFAIINVIGIVRCLMS